MYMEGKGMVYTQGFYQNESLDITISSVPYMRTCDLENNGMTHTVRSAEVRIRAHYQYCSAAHEEWGTSWCHTVHIMRAPMSDIIVQMLMGYRAHIHSYIGIDHLTDLIWWYTTVLISEWELRYQSITTVHEPISTVHGVWGMAYSEWHHIHIATYYIRMRSPISDY